MLAPTKMFKATRASDNNYKFYYLNRNVSNKEIYPTISNTDRMVEVCLNVFANGTEVISRSVDEQSWYWSARWQKMERNAEEALASGDYDDFESIDDFILSLEEQMGDE